MNTVLGTKLYAVTVEQVPFSYLKLGSPIGRKSNFGKYRKKNLLSLVYFFF